MIELMALAGGALSFWFVFVWIACGALSAHAAVEKNRCGFCWFMWGVLLGPLAVIATAGLPKISSTHKTHMQCHMCHEFVRPKSRKCKHCHTEFAPDEHILNTKIQR